MHQRVTTSKLTIKKTGSEIPTFSDIATSNLVVSEKQMSVVTYLYIYWFIHSSIYCNASFLINTYKYLQPCHFVCWAFIFHRYADSCKWLPRLTSNTQTPLDVSIEHIVTIKDHHQIYECRRKWHQLHGYTIKEAERDCGIASLE